MKEADKGRNIGAGPGLGLPKPGQYDWNGEEAAKMKQERVEFFQGCRQVFGLAWSELKEMAEVGSRFYYGEFLSDSEEAVEKAMACVQVAEVGKILVRRFGGGLNLVREIPRRLRRKAIKEVIDQYDDPAKIESLRQSVKEGIRCQRRVFSVMAMEKAVKICLLPEYDGKNYFQLMEETLEKDRQWWLECAGRDGGWSDEVSSNEEEMIEREVDFFRKNITMIHEQYLVPAMEEK